MATNVATLTAKLTVDSSGVKKGMDKADREIGGFAGKAKTSLGKIGPAVAAGAAVAGVAVAGFAVKSVSAFADFEKGMNEVFTLMPGMSEKAMKSMEGDVKDFSKTMGITTDETIPALYQAISAGVPPDNVFEFMETAAQASIAGVTDMETAVDGISSAVNAYGADALSATEASDMMFTAVKLGKTDFGQLSASMFQVAPIASGLGVEFSNVTAALAALTAQGVPTSVAATQIKTAMAELGKEGSIAFDHFVAATGKTFPDFIAEGGNLQEAFAAMKTSADDTGTGVQNLFGSIEAGQAALALTSESGGPAFVSAMEEMETSTGATKTAFETMEGSMSRTWDKIKANLQVALVDIGGKLAPMVEEWSEAFLRVLPGAIDFLIGSISGLIGFIQDFVRGAQAIVDWVKNLPGPIKTLVVAIGTITAALALLYANPVVAGLALVAGAVAFIGGNARDAEGQIRDLEASLVDLGEEGDRSISGNLTAAIKSIGDETPGAISALNDMGLSYKDVERAIARGDKTLGEWLREVLRTEKPMKGNITDVKELEKAFGPLEDAYGNVADESAAAMEEVRRETLKTLWETEQNAAGMEVAWDQFNRSMGYVLADAGTSAADYATQVGSASGDVSSTLDGSVIDWAAWEAELGMSMEHTALEFEKTTGGMVDGFNGATDQIELTADEFMTNLQESMEQKAEFEALFKELGDKGMFGLQQALLDGGPASVGVIGDIASDQTKAYEANLMLSEAAGIEIGRLSEHERAAYSWAFSLGASMHNAWVDGFGTMWIHIPPVQATGRAQDIGIHWNAAGGVAMGPTLLQGLGEAGPEAIVPLDKWPDLVEQTGGGGGGDINVYVEGNLFGAATAEDLVELIESERRQYRLRGGTLV